MVAWKNQREHYRGDEVYLVRVLDDPGPSDLPLPPARYTTSTGAVYEALGARKFTSPARFLGGSNVT